LTRVRLGRGAYWALGWLLTIVVTYVGTQYARSRGVVAPVVSGPAPLVFGALLCGIGVAIARRTGREWAGVVVAGFGIVSFGLGLANLVR
jgi:hypothetical protein